MNCKQADNLLIDYLYGELSTDKRSAFERHLESCPEHAKEVAKLKGVLNLVRTQEPEEVPEAVSARILQSARGRMPRRERPASWLTFLWNPVAAAAVLALVVATVGIATYYMSEQPMEAEPALDAAHPMAAPIETAEAPEVEAKAEEKKEFAPAPPEVVAEAPAPPPKPPVEKKPKRKKRRRPATKKRAFKGFPAEVPKSPPAWGAKTKAKPSVPTGVRGGAPADSVALGKTTTLSKKPDRSMEGAGGDVYRRAEREKKTKDEKVSRTDKESRFAKPPPGAAMQPAPEPPAKAAPAPRPKEDYIEEESVPMATEAEADDSYSQVPARRAKKKQPTDYYRAAEADLANKRYDAAVSKYRTFLSRNPTDHRAPTCRYRIAKALFLADRCSEAIQAVREAVAASPKHPMAPGALLDQGSCYERLSRLSEAETTYRRVLRNYPTHEDEAQKGIRRLRRETDIKPAATEQHR